MWLKLVFFNPPTNKTTGKSCTVIQFVSFIFHQETSNGVARILVVSNLYLLPRFWLVVFEDCKPFRARLWPYSYVFCSVLFLFFFFSSSSSFFLHLFLRLRLRLHLHLHLLPFFLFLLLLLFCYDFVLLSCLSFAFSLIKLIHRPLHRVYALLLVCGTMCMFDYWQLKTPIVNILPWTTKSACWISSTPQWAKLFRFRLILSNYCCCCFLCLLSCLFVGLLVCLLVCL